MEAGLTSKTIIIEDEGGSTADKSGLQNAINDAEEHYNNAVVGIENGCYWEADKHAFKAAIDDAKAVLDDPNASQPTVDTATNDLRAAIAVFEASAINPSTGDIDNSSTIDVADLAKVAYFFGSKSGDPNWDEAVIADINKDGIISIDDLAFIASRM